MSIEPLSFTAVCRSHAQERTDRRAFTFSDGDVQKDAMTFGELDLAARAVGSALQQRALIGERVLLLFNSGPEFIRSFFGCLYGGAVAVPVNLPTQKRRLEKIVAIADNSGAKLILTTAAIAAELEAAGLHLPCLDLEGLLGAGAAGLERAWRDPQLPSDAPAFLQYTSGSTGSPKGVIVSHGNLLANQAMIKESFGHNQDTVFAGWLPLYHDMGLVGNVMQPIYLGIHCALMPPVAFTQQPVRWLKLISEHGATTSGAPNFAYELCVRRISEEDLAGIDLSSWKVAFNGAEPIRAETLHRFAERFGRYGFKRTSMYPCYGMAEATLLISGGLHEAEPVLCETTGAALEVGDLAQARTQADEKARVLVGCGRTWGEQRIRIVNPESFAPCAAGVVGEIWVAGPNVAHGYWKNEEATAATFGARTRDGEGPFLRTGDLGFLHDGELFVTGRIKDVIIVAGKNHYPQDIELTVSRCHAAVDGRPGAAFLVPRNGVEELAVVQEVNKSFLRSEIGKELRAHIRDEVLREHGLAPRQVALIKPGALPLTTSGKVQRRLCRTLLTDKQFDEVLLPESAPAPVVAQSESR